MAHTNATISVIGLGKLGLCTATCFAHKGFSVTGVDIRADVVVKINQGESPIQETGLQALLTKCKNNLYATTSVREAVAQTDVVFIIVPTPSDDLGSFSNEYVIRVLDQVALALTDKESFTIVSIISTVMPGTMDTVFKPLLEKESGKVCGRDFGLAYNPEFVALGSVIHDFLNPDIILIGESDQKTGDVLQHIYTHACDNQPYVARMNVINAEITKLSINCYVTMKISFANTLSGVCEQFPGADVDVIANAIGHDSRIGTKYIRGGLGFGGPCFPRDNRAFMRMAQNKGVRAPISEAVVQVNEMQAQRIVARIRELLSPGKKITVLGVSYKPDTNIVEESQALQIARELKELGYMITVYDPGVCTHDFSVFILVQSLDEALRDCDLCVITTPWGIFKQIQPAQLNPNAIVFDCWRLLDEKSFPQYYALGKGGQIERVTAAEE